MGTVVDTYHEGVVYSMDRPCIGGHIHMGRHDDQDKVDDLVGVVDMEDILGHVTEGGNNLTDVCICRQGTAHLSSGSHRIHSDDYSRLQGNHSDQHMGHYSEGVDLVEGQSSLFVESVRLVEVVLHVKLV